MKYRMATAVFRRYKMLRTQWWYIAGLAVFWLFAAGDSLAEVSSALDKPALSPPGPVFRLEVEGIIDPVVAKYIDRGITRAEREQASLVVLVLDTPGGLDKSMRRITKRLLNAKVGIAVFVHPAGARAASAGAFMGLAAHVLAMTPGTNIGAAHPVDLQGKKASPKVANDAIAYIIGLARQRDRNEKWAGQMVEKSASLPAEDAVSHGIADMTVPDISALMKKLDGKEIKLAQGQYQLNLAGAEIRNLPMRRDEKFLHALTNPNVTYVLFLVGIYGIIYELASPGAILPGVAGAIGILLALMGFGGLPISLAGMLLLALGAILLVLEIFVASHGILALGGLAALLLGSFMVFPSELPAFQVAHSIIWTMLAISAAYVGLFIYVVIRLRKAKVISGMESLTGARGYVKPGTLGGMMVHVQGDDWLITPDSGKLEPGQEVEVLAVKGLRLKVRTCDPAGNLKNHKEE